MYFLVVVICLISKTYNVACCVTIITCFDIFTYRAPLHEECPQHDGYKGDPGVTPGTCGAIGERAQVILLWVRAPGVGNVSHLRRLEIMRVSIG